jgi:hypothetical protein
MRTRVTPGHLYGLLSAEFAAKRPFGCDDCRMPLPYRIERPDPVSANWRIGTPRECPRKCHVVMAEIGATFWPLFDLRDETPEPTKTSPTTTAARG